MQYLYRPDRPSGRYHLFEDGDTLCRMWSTNGIRHSKKCVFADAPPPGRDCCSMCSRAREERQDMNHLRSI